MGRVMRSLLLHHAMPVMGIWLLAFAVGVLITPADGMLTALFAIGGFSVGVAAYVLGVQVGRQSDPMRPRYLRERAPTARETVHVVALTLLSAAVALLPAAWILRDGFPGSDVSAGWTAMWRALLNGYWGPITLGLLLLAWGTRGK